MPTLVEVKQYLGDLEVWGEVEEAPVERIEEGRFRLQLRLSPHVTPAMARGFAERIELRLDGQNARQVVFLGYQDLQASQAHRLLLEVLLGESIGARPSLKVAHAS